MNDTANNVMIPARLSTFLAWIRAFLVLLLASFIGLANPAGAIESITYYHNDVSGTPLLATDASGNVLWKENYRPYGEKLNNSPAASDNRLGFAGKPYDEATGLSYMGARYYDPALGRFMGIDPKEVDVDEVHSFNRYAYANNNPYKFVDPDGHSPLDVVFLAYDIGKLGVAIYTGQGVGAALLDVGSSVVGVASPVPGTGQAIKAVRAAERAVDAAKGARALATGARQAEKGAEAAKGFRPDFVVTSSGTAVPVSQSRMREGFEAAGFPSRAADKTAESGVIHTVPTRNGTVDVRTMEGSADHPRRAVFTREGTNDPVRMDGRQFPNGTSRADRRAGSHLGQTP